MKRFAPVLIAVLATVALVTAAGSFDAASGPSVDGGTLSDEDSQRDGGGGAGGADGDGGGSSSGDAVGADSETPAGDRGGGGVSWVVSILFVGAVGVGLLLLVLLTDDDERATVSGDDGRDDGSGPSGPPVDPSYSSPDENAVVRAWRRLRDSVDGTDPSATPGETAAAALDRGLPAEAVTTLTRQFRAVRYGRERSDPERERRAERIADRIAVDADGRGTERDTSDDRSAESGGGAT